jgi:hypothetical protein
LGAKENVCSAFVLKFPKILGNRGETDEYRIGVEGLDQDFPLPLQLIVLLPER